MLSQKAHRAVDHLLLWPRCHGSVSRCRAATIFRAANIAPELVQLERSCLADLSTEELEQQLKKHGACMHTLLLLESMLAAKSLQNKLACDTAGISIQTKPRTKQQQIPPQHADTRPAAAQLDHHQLEQQQQKQHHSQQDRPKHPQHPQQQQQRPPHPAEASRSQQQKQQARSRSRRVAAAAARRALLLEQLANARVQARSRIVRLPLRLSIAGRAKSRRYLTVPVDVEGVSLCVTAPVLEYREFRILVRSETQTSLQLLRWSQKFQSRAGTPLCASTSNPAGMFAASWPFRTVSNVAA